MTCLSSLVLPAGLNSGLYWQHFFVGEDFSCKPYLLNSSLVVPNTSVPILISVLKRSLPGRKFLSLLITLRQSIFLGTFIIRLTQAVGIVTSLFVFNHVFFFSVYLEGTQLSHHVGVAAQVAFEPLLACIKMTF